METRVSMMRAKWAWMVVLAGGLALVACKRKAAKVPTIEQAPRIAAPTAEDVIEEKRLELLKELDPVPMLGEGVAKVIPDGTPEGERWDTYPNGMMIHDLKRYDGSTPKLGQTVSIVYRGTFPSPDRAKEKVFDQNSADNPLQFKLGSKKIIRGLSLGISSMKSGSKRRIYIPADLAYGAAGDPERQIPPNQPLIFEVELLSVTGEALDPSLLAPPKVEPLGPPAPATAPATKP